MMPEVVHTTDVHITQEEYDKLFKYHNLAKRVIRYTYDTDEDYARKLKTREDRYERYRIYLSDKYNIELLRSDGSYFAIDGLQVVYVLG